MRQCPDSEKDGWEHAWTNYKKCMESEYPMGAWARATSTRWASSSDRHHHLFTLLEDLKLRRRGW